MHQTSSTYQKILAGPHRVETVLQVGSNADVAVCWSIPGTVYGEDMITKISQKGDILDREAPGIGYFVARKLEVTMLDPSKQVAVMGRLVPFSRLVSDSGVSEWIPKGIFYVDTRKKAMVDAQAATVDIVAYDAGLKASIDYDTSALSWPATDVQVVADIAGKIETAYDASNLTGGFSIGVVLHDGEGKKYTAGSGEMLESESPWASQAAASQALSAVNGYRYQAFSARQAIIKPHMELGDYITVGAASGLMCSYYFDMDTYVGDVGAPEEYEINRKYPYRTTAARAGGVGRAAKRIAKQAVGNIIENYNQLIAALNGKDGVPEDLASGLKNYVRYDLKNGDMLATSELFSKIGEKARSEITTYAYVDKDGNAHSLVDIMAKVDDTESGLSTKVGTKALNETLKNYALASALSNYLTVTAAAELYVTDSDVTAAIGAYIVQDANGNRKSLAAILADVIKLQGDTEVVGNLTVSDGRLRVSKGIIANGNSNIWGDLAVSGKLFVNNNNLYISGEPYVPTEITSKSGTKYMVLGA